MLCVEKRRPEDRINVLRQTKSGIHAMAFPLFRPPARIRQNLCSFAATRRWISFCVFLRHVCFTGITLCNAYFSLLKCFCLIASVTQVVIYTCRKNTLKLMRNLAKNLICQPKPAKNRFCQLLKVNFVNQIKFPHSTCPM